MSLKTGMYRLLSTGLCAAGFALSACGEDAPPPKEVVKPALIVEVGGDTNIVQRQFPGVVRANEEVELSFRVAGLLKEFSVVAGQEFKAGDILARLDQRDFEVNLDLAASSLQGQQAQMGLLKAGAREEDIVKLEAEVASTKSAYSAALAQFERYEKLFEKGDIGKADYDAQKNARDAAKARLAQAEKSLEIGRKGGRKEDLQIQAASVGGAAAQVASAKDALEYTILKAPFDGVVAKTYVDNHEEIQAKQVVLSYHNMGRLKIDVDVPEDLALTINRFERTKLVATFEALPGREFPLFKEEVSTAADPVTRTYRVTLGMEPPKDVRILPGMSATVILHLRQKGTTSSTVFNVPVAAVNAVNAKAPFVWVVEPKSMKVAKAAVKVGPVIGDNIQVLEGLKAGQLVVAAGSNSLVPGQKVKKMETVDDSSAGGK